MKENLIWEGIYEQFGDVPVVGDGFEGDKWAENSARTAVDLLQRAQKLQTIPEVVAYRESLLPFLAALVYHQLGRVRILDFGGGLGFTYIPVASALMDAQAIDYHIVESQRICDLGAEMFAHEDRLHFHTAPPSDPDRVDILHIGSALQYIEDWTGLLKRLADYQPNYFLFSNLSAGDIPTYATAQLYFDSNIAAWFLNIDEFIASMSGLGFGLLFKSTFKASLHGKEQALPQANFPQQYRLGHTCSLLFGAEGSKHKGTRT